MRIKNARARHRAWSGVVVLMLALPFWSAWGPRLTVPVLPSKLQPEVVWNVAAEAVPVIGEETSSNSRAITSSIGLRPPSAKAQLSSASVIRGVYITGVAILLLRLGTGLVGAYLVRRRAWFEDGNLTSSHCFSPITIGLLRAVTILPDGWREWPQGKLDVVLAHESEHVVRRDPLLQCLAMLNRAVFWFHPLAWWLERQLAVLSEEACDMAVLEQGHDPRDYSEYLLELARSVVQSSGRLRALGVAMPGHNLPQRIHKILRNAKTQKLSRLRILCTLGICAILTIPLAAMTLAPAYRMPRVLVAPPPVPTATLVSETSSVARPPEKREEVAPSAPQPVPAPTYIRPQTAPTPQFEVASIKPCQLGGRGQRGTEPGARGGGPGTPIVSPGRLNLVCQTVKQLIQQAYLTFAEGKSHSLLLNPTTIEGAADWINTERYEVSATADPGITQQMMRGPMMQALLEDRFKLKVHRETREVPVYIMIVLKTGFKLQPLEEGSCDARDLTAGPRPAIITPEQGFREVLQPGEKPSCGVAVRTSHGPTDPIQVVIGQAMGLTEFAGLLGSGMDRPVIDKTEVTGVFNLHLQFARDQVTAGFLPPSPPGFPVDPQPVVAAEPAGPSIFTAIQEQLGLRLDQGRGPGQFLIIDHVEKPSEN